MQIQKHCFNLEKVTLFYGGLFSVLGSYISSNMCAIVNYINNLVYLTIPGVPHWNNTKY